MGESAGYYRHPAIHGDRLVFVCEDDLFTVPVAGGVARRLTANPGTTTFPVFSPDGRHIAFVGRDDGPAEAYVIAADGGPARRLTWFGSFTATVGWSRDGTSVIVASDVGQPFKGYVHLHAVPTSGAPTSPLSVGPARAISFEPGGRGTVIGRNSGDPARWKRYRGGTAGTIWIDVKGDGSYAPLLSLPGNLANPMWIGGRIYFLSDHEAHGNLYSCLPSGADVRRHTHHEDFYVRFPSTDGRRIAYHAGADLFVFDPATGAASKVPVRFESSRPQRNRKFVSASRHLESADLHPAGHSIVLASRGGAHAGGLFDGPPARLGAAQGVRLRLPHWLPDGRRVVAVTDEGGEEALTVLSADGSARARRVAGDLGRALDLVVAPAGGDLVALSNQRQEAILVDLASGTVRVLEKSPYQRIQGLAFSPDGRWLAYGFADTRAATSIHVADTRTGEVRRVTRPDFQDTDPAFDPEGRWLYFLSGRVFDPVYDSHYFDLGFPKGSRPYLIPLRKDAVSPFSSTVRAPRGPEATPPPTPPAHGANASGTTTAGAPAAASAATSTPESAAGPASDKGAPPACAIDFDGIEDRVVAFPVAEGKYQRILGARGRAVFLSVPPEGSLDQEARGSSAPPPANGHLEAWDFAEDKAVSVATGVTTFETSLLGKALLVRSGNRLRALAAGALAKDLSAKDEAGRETGWLDLERFRVAVDPGAEWRQMFREAWRLQRDQFWTADMSNVDWPAIHDRYLPLVERVGSRAEFSDLMWEMQGELATSHCYEMGGDYRPEPTWWQGFLGVDVAYDAAAKAWKVTRIPRGDSWDLARASALAAPGLGIAVGDEILAVDGEPLASDAGPAAKLVHTAGRDVRLIVRHAGEVRTLAVRTMRDEQPMRYRDWVEANRARVHAASKGRLGYVHVPNMGPLGYSEFHRYYRVEVEHEGLVVDVRWNGGGHVSQLLLEKLARRRVAYDFTRHMGASSYPDAAPMGPMVALTNEYAGSDGDIFSHNFKQYGLGPLIGKRTWGGVVGIWPRHALVDGTVTTQPEFAYWFEDGGFGVEGHGTDPDVEVEIRPQDHAKGLDPQLERGIAEAMALVEKTKPRIPDPGPRPDRRPPPLPKA